MRKKILTLAMLGGAMLLAGCADDLRGQQNLMVDNNCSGNGHQNESYCTGSLHPYAGPYGTAYRDSTWHQFDDQAWLDIE
jgi:hypothetical protein